MVPGPADPLGQWPLPYPARSPDGLDQDPLAPPAEPKYNAISTEGSAHRGLKRDHHEA